MPFQIEAEDRQRKWVGEWVYLNEQCLGCESVHQSESRPRGMQQTLREWKSTLCQPWGVSYSLGEWVGAWVWREVMEVRLQSKVMVQKETFFESRLWMVILPYLIQWIIKYFNYPALYFIQLVIWYFNYPLNTTSGYGLNRFSMGMYTRLIQHFFFFKVRQA